MITSVASINHSTYSETFSLLIHGFSSVIDTTCRPSTLEVRHGSSVWIESAPLNWCGVGGSRICGIVVCVHESRILSRSRLDSQALRFLHFQLMRRTHIGILVLPQRGTCMVSSWWIGHSSLGKALQRHSGSRWPWVAVIAASLGVELSGRGTYRTGRCIGFPGNAGVGVLPSWLAPRRNKVPRWVTAVGMKPALLEEVPALLVALVPFHGLAFLVAA